MVGHLRSARPRAPPSTLREETPMAVTINPQTIGPVDVAVIGFVGDTFQGEIVPALQELVDSEVVRIIDLSFVAKAANGETRALEVSESEIAAAFVGFDDDQHDLLNEDDLEVIAEGLEPATAALVIVWENRWAARFAEAVRHADGFLVSQDRIPHQTVVRAIEALEDN
jgi:dihydroorotase-like cyclic amidohydrolase